MADVLVLLVFSALVITYCWDAYQASSHIINLILIAPVSLLVIVLCAVELVQQLRGHRAQENEEPREPVSDVLPVMGLFALYVVGLPWLGFDVGTVLFVAAFLWVHGERRLHWIFVYSLLFGIAVSWFFSKMLPYPLPMLLLPTEY